MEMMLLEECCEIHDSMRIPITASNRKEGIYPYYGANGIQDHVADYIFDDELVLLAEDGGNFGSKTRPIAYRVSGKCWVNNHAHVLKPKEGLNVDFLCYSLMFYNTEGLVNGATRQKLTQTTMRKMLIPNLSIENQLYIVNQLNKLLKIMELRKKEIQQLDNLTKARFVEMFGDPIQNPKGWDMPLIEEVVANEKNALKAGPFGSALKKEYYVASGYKIYGQEQVISDDCTFGDYYIDEERYKSLENCAVQPGDVLISLVGTYGKLLIMPEVFEPGIINPRLMKITFDKEKVNPYYFKFFFQSESLKKALSQNTHGGTMDILNLGIVRKIEMPLPPLKLQNEFVDFVHQVDKSLFDGLYISQNKALCDEHMGKYPVIFLTLKGVEGLTFADAKMMLKSILSTEMDRHYYLKTSDALTDEDKAYFVKMLTGTDENINDSLRKLSQLLYKHYGKKAVILIDEYDVPLDKAFNQYFRLYKNNTTYSKLFSTP